MRSLIEAALFVPLAAGLHVAAFAVVGSPTGAVGGAAGMGGESLVSVAAAPEAYRALAEEWRTPPQAVPAPAALPAPTRAAPPNAPLPVQKPERIAAPRVPPAPPLDALPAMPSAPLERPGHPAAHPVPADIPPASPPTPKDADTAPERTPRTTTPPPQSGQIAQGAGRATTSGAGAEAVPTLSPAQVRGRRAEWGAQILARVNRHHRYPSGTRASGQAQVELVLARDGRVVSVRLIRSAGDAALDRAALTAVRRAGRFPAAPTGLTEPRYSFTVPLRFERGG